MSEKKRFLLRLESDLYAGLERWAADDLRSINAQIEFLLKDALRRNQRLKGGDRRSTGTVPSRTERDSG